MLTFRAMAAGAPSQAAAMAAHLGEQTLAADRQALARYYTQAAGAPALGPEVRDAVRAVARIEAREAAQVERPDLATALAERAADRKVQQARELDEIRAGLRASAEAVAERLLGKPESRRGKDWRWPGAVEVAMRGPERGSWYDFQAGQGGDLLALIERQQGGGFRNAVSWARSFLGMPEPNWAKPLSAEERAAMARTVAARVAEAERRREAEARAVAARHETVSRRATAVWAGSPPAPADHPYLVAKGVQPHGLRVDRRGRLRVPLMDETGKIWSLQHIDGRGEKRFHRAARAGGTFFVLGDVDPATPVAFAEGFATAASVREATGLPVVVTFSVGNKAAVMRAWRERHPDQVLIDAADNDHAKPAQGKRNAGAEMAARLEAEIGAVPALPPFKEGEPGSDWNDFVRNRGLATGTAAFGIILQEARDRRLPPSPPPLPEGVAVGTPADVQRDMHPLVAEALGVVPGGVLTEREVAHLLEGRRADGSAMPGRSREISAIDLCFSADKSVSLAWAFAPTEAERAAILQAHKDACASAMAYVAAEIGWARKGESGKDGAEPGHVGWVSFDHFASRPTVELVTTDPVTGVQATEIHTLRKHVAGDPNLHTHHAMLNVVVTDNGRVGSLDQQRLHNRVHEFGAFYQACLATNLRRAGVPVELDRKTGAARIPTIPDRIRQAFSKRTADAHEAAREYARERGLDWDALDDNARAKLLKGGAVESRRSKRDDLSDFEAWRRQAEGLNWRHRSVLRPDLRQEVAPEADRIQRAYEAAMGFVADLFHKRSVVSGWDMRTAAARGLVASGVAGVEDIDRVTKAFRDRGVQQDGRLTRLLWGDDRGQGRGFVSVTTALHVDQERELVALAQRAAADRSGALSRRDLDAAVRASGLDFSGEHGEAQHRAMVSLGTGGRLAVAIGAAGSGKTAMLAPLVAAWKQQGLVVYGIAQAWRQSDDLAGAGIEPRNTMALMPFLGRAEQGKLALGPQSVVVVDELGQIGARQMLDLLRLREQHGFTLVAVGDHRQCQAIEAGPVIDLLRKALGEAAVPEILTTIRQQTERERETATLFREGRAKEALGRKLEDNTVEIVPGGYREAVQRAADLWVERQAANRGVPGYSLTVSAPTNADARAISEAIRDRRRGLGEIGADLAVVKATDQGGQARYDLALAAGDRVRLFDRTWGRTEDGRKVRAGNNGSVVEVVDATPDGLTVRTREGIKAQVSWADLRDRRTQRVRLTYGDALTIDAAQGITSTEHIAAMPAGSRAVTGFKGYVSASRHRVTTWIITSDGQERQEVMSRRPLGDPRPVTRADVIENMAQNLSRQKPKDSALDFLRRASDLHRGVARGLQSGMQRMEDRAIHGKYPTTAHTKMDRAKFTRGLREFSERALRQFGQSASRNGARARGGWSMDR